MEDTLIRSEEKNPSVPSFRHSKLKARQRIVSAIPTARPVINAFTKGSVEV
jgi:hypothetical protein